jgi:hypothetical protein
MKIRMILPILGVVLLLCSCEQHLLPKEDSNTPAFLYFDANGGEFNDYRSMRIFVGYYEEYWAGYYFSIWGKGKPSRDGYTLLGWNYVKDASSYYTDFNIILSTNTDTIYAIWEKDKEYAKVRFKKVLDYTYVTRMGIYSLPINFTSTKQLASYYFGTSDGTSSYYEIESGSWYPAYYYTEYSGEWKTLNAPYYFEANQKYTFVTSDDGQYLTFYVTKDGAWNAPERLPEKRDTIQQIRTQIPIK